MIETREGIKNLESILNLKIIDAIMVGPYDLSGSINEPGNFSSIKFKKLITKYEKTSIKKNIPMGYHQVQLDQNKLREIVKKNYKYICIGTDLEFLRNSYSNFLYTFNKK